MKFYFLLISTLIITSCASESAPNDSDLTQETEENTDIEPIPEVFIYKSTDLGSTEYLKCTRNGGNKSTWVYYTAKKPKEIELGVTSHRGMEMLFFKSSPDVIYDILGSECGFTLEENDDVSQWYEQISPACEMNTL
ncbi:MAG: hypothetical protein P8M19_01695 [Crocinitomicaceae bacterium]|nr:hypothetical protein [Crocinitomicaceae bacterium]MDG1658093.1 hypothetical protein [Crocinitomicaceae bacterium]MDG2440358.1 hypothetical protein [Crocinitomicaceae bacterium]